MRQLRQHVLALAALLALVLALLPRPALAADIRNGDAILVGAGETVNDDLYAFGSSITVLGTVNGDVVAAGSTILVSGTVDGDLIVAGGNVTVTGHVTGSIRAAGGNLTVSGPVGGDVVVAGGNIALARSASVGRDLLIGGNATVDAPVARNLLAGGETLRLASGVGGDVRARAAQVQLADGAAIGGSLLYTSDQDAQIAAGVPIGGTVQRTPANVNMDEARPNAAAPLLGWLRWFVGLAALGLAFVLGLPRFSRDAAAALRASPGVSFALGAAALVGVPIVALIVFGVGLLIGGWWLAFLVLCLYAVALAVGLVISAYVGGSWLADHAGRGSLHPAWSLLAGALVLAILTAIPVVGGWIALLAMLFGLGALVEAVGRGRGAAMLGTPSPAASASPSAPPSSGRVAGA